MSSTSTNAAERLPKLGEIVIFHFPEGEQSNGAKSCPAMVTRVWGANCVNIKVFPDCGEVKDRTSVPQAFHGGNSWGFSYR